MSYYVSLGDVDFDNVVSVNQSGEREISVYDSVGGGKFAVPQNKGLRTWTIKFQSDDPDMFDDFDKMLRKKTPARLIVKSDNDKVSERVLLKSYSKEETEYSGVYNVTVTVLEYVKAGVRTTSVPYVAREGNAVLPKAQILGDGQNGTKTAYDLFVTAQRTADSPYGPLEGGFKRKVFDSEEKRNAYLASVQFIDVETGKEVNPAAAEGKTVDVVNNSREFNRNRTKFATSVEAAMDKALDDFWTWANTPVSQELTDKFK